MPWILFADETVHRVMHAQNHLVDDQSSRYGHTAVSSHTLSVLNMMKPEDSFGSVNPTMVYCTTARNPGLGPNEPVGYDYAEASS